MFFAFLIEVPSSGVSSFLIFCMYVLIPASFAQLTWYQYILVWCHILLLLLGCIRVLCGSYDIAGDGTPCSVHVTLQACGFYRMVATSPQPAGNTRPVCHTRHALLPFPLSHRTDRQLAVVGRPSHGHDLGHLEAIAFSRCWLRDRIQMSELHYIMAAQLGPGTRSPVQIQPSPRLVICVPALFLSCACPLCSWRDGLPRLSLPSSSLLSSLTVPGASTHGVRIRILWYFS